MSQASSVYSLGNPQEPISQASEILPSQKAVTLHLVGVVLESMPTRRASPVHIVDGVIRVDEDQMEEGEPYAFQYQGKYHMLTRTDGKLRLYELR